LKQLNGALPAIDADTRGPGVTDEQINALMEPESRRRSDVFSVEEQAILRYT
jgi:hypothetical protein